MIAIRAFRKAMQDIATKKGPFTFFGLFMRADAYGRWDLVVSAPWLHKSQLKATRELAELLTDSGAEEALKQVSRIQTIDGDDPALKAVLEAFSVDDGEVRVQKSNLFGLEIEDALILRAMTPTSNTSARRTIALTSP